MKYAILLFVSCVPLCYVTVRSLVDPPAEPSGNNSAGTAVQQDELGLISKSLDAVSAARKRGDADGRRGGISRGNRLAGRQSGRGPAAGGVGVVGGRVAGIPEPPGSADFSGPRQGFAPGRADLERPARRRSAHPRSLSIVGRRGGAAGTCWRSSSRPRGGPDLRRALPLFSTPWKNRKPSSRKSKPCRRR